MEKIRANEALDIRNYATAAMVFMNPNFENLKNMKREKLIKLSEHDKPLRKKRATSGIVSKGVKI